MKINLKTTILFSVSIAAALNVGQFFASYKQRELAFDPAFASAASAPASTTPAPTKVTAAHPAVTNPTPAPAPDPSVTSASTELAQAGLNPGYAALYVATSQRTGTPWQLLAAVHEVETGQSGSTNRTSYAGATGPMQFMPATFNHYATDGNGDGVKNITNLDDSMLTAGRYLAANGAAAGNYTNALYVYNHSSAYVSQVLAIANRLGL